MNTDIGSPLWMLVDDVREMIAEASAEGHGNAVDIARYLTECLEADPTGE